jgi:hypothetical protein
LDFSRFDCELLAAMSQAAAIGQFLEMATQANQDITGSTYMGSAAKLSMTSTTCASPVSPPPLMRPKVQRGGRGGGGRSKNCPAAEYPSSGHTFSESGSSMRSSGSGSSKSESSTSGSGSHGPQVEALYRLTMYSGFGFSQARETPKKQPSGRKGDVAPWPEAPMREFKASVVPQNEGASSRAGSNEVGWLSRDLPFMQRLWSMDAAKWPHEWSFLQGLSSRHSSMASKEEKSYSGESSTCVSSAA